MSASRRPPRDLFGRAGYGRIETPDVRGHGAVRARSRGVDRHRPQGDVHLRGPGRAQRHAAPRGDGADLPRLRRARDAQAPAAGEALVLGPVLPLRGAAGRAASASSTRSTPRRSAPTRPLVDAELIVLLDDLLRELGVPGVRAAALEPRLARGARELPRASSRATCATHEGELSQEVRERIDANPLRAFDSDDEGTRAVMAEAPTMLDRLDGRGRRALRRGSRAARPRRGRLRARRHARPRARLLHPHRLRVHLRSPRRPVGRRRRRAATTGSSRSSAGRRRRRSAGRRGSSGSCSRSARATAPSARDVFVAAATASASRRWPSRRSCGAPGSRAELDLAGRGLKGQMKQADRVGAAPAR